MDYTMGVNPTKNKLNVTKEELLVSIVIEEIQAQNGIPISDVSTRPINVEQLRGVRVA